MSIKHFMIALFSTIFFSTAAYSSNNAYTQHLWSQVCQRDVSCKWEGDKCTYKNKSIMRFHCEQTTKTTAKVIRHLDMHGGSLVGRR